MAYQSNSAVAESSASQTGAQALPVEPRRPLFPPIMNGYAQLGKQGFRICGETEQDHLYHVDIHSGYSLSGPLGSRPGVVLHQGLDTKTPILAAAGYESQGSARIYAFDNQTVVLMPSLLPAAERTSEFITEQMPATVRGEQVARLIKGRRDNVRSLSGESLRRVSLRQLQRAGLNLYGCCLHLL